ncbi:MAG: hypothetical protein HY460_01175 [Parcubacteria group bacterium]|nr:hypothetical protein [Parcubacteria group bacterium]
MPHGEILKNGVIVIKPDARMRRVLQGVNQFFGKLTKSTPNVRPLLRQEQILHWLNRELTRIAGRARYHGKAVYLAFDEHMLVGVKDIGTLVKTRKKDFVLLDQFRTRMGATFRLIAREKIRSERKRREKKQVQTYGEPRYHRK